MARLPETRYAKGPGGNIAYQVVGDGPVDLVIVPGWLSHVDLMWGDPAWAKFVGELSSFARVILYDERGTGPVDRSTRGLGIGQLEVPRDRNNGGG